MRKTRRLIATVAAAVVVAAVPSAASADEVRVCADTSDVPVTPGTLPNAYVCVEHIPGYGGISVGVQQNTYVLSHEETGLYLCFYQPGSQWCPLFAFDPTLRL